MIFDKWKLTWCRVGMQPPLSSAYWKSIQLYNCLFQEVLHTIASPHGRVSRIVIHNRTEEKIESLIEFDSIMSAEACKDAINGADIYAGCCTLDVKFSKVSILHSHLIQLKLFQVVHTAYLLLILHIILNFSYRIDKDLKFWVSSSKYYVLPLKKSIVYLRSICYLKIFDIGLLLACLVNSFRVFTNILMLFINSI